MIPLFNTEHEETILVPTQNYGDDLEEGEEEGIQEWIDDDTDQEDQPPETRQLLFISAIPATKRAILDVQEVVSQETALREGQANDALAGLRNSLAYLSLVFRTKVRNAKSQYTKTRAWDEVGKANIQLRKYVSTYRTARNALIQLGAPRETLNQFQEIKKDNLKMPGDIVEANRIGQRSDAVAWFWRLDNDKDGDNEGWMKECKCLQLLLYL